MTGERIPLSPRLPKAITLSAAMRDPALFGSTFNKSSFWPWFTIAKLIDGLPLSLAESQLFHQFTGRTMLPTRPVRRLDMLIGRRGGKDRFLSAVAVHRAALAADWSRFMSAGEPAVVLLLGVDKQQANILRRYCEGLLEASSLLKAQVTRQTNSALEFRNGATLEIATNDARLVRGRSAIAVFGSEVAYWRTDESSASSDQEVVSAAAPSLSLCPDGGLMILGSSVYRKKGFLYRRWQQLHGNDGADDICWLAPSRAMNPLLPEAVVTKALEADPHRAKAEYLSEWREDLSDFIPSDAVDSCVERGVRERPPRPDIRYIAFADAAGGTGSDSFALCIAHAEPDGSVWLDAVRERKPRFIPAQVIYEFADLLRFYRVNEVQGDRFAGGFHSDEWRRNNIVYKAADNTTSENYLGALPLLLSGRARLVDEPVLRKQLVELERKAHGSGRESVSHPDSASAHDDVAAAACGALVLAARGKRRITTVSMTSSDGLSGGIRVDPITMLPIGVPRSRIVYQNVDEHGHILRERRVST